MCKFLLSDKIPFADDERKRAFEELGKIHTNCAEYNSDEPVWQNRSMVISCGRLAEICESWDQMNAYSRRKGIIRIIVAISCAALVAAYKLEFNIHMYVKFRHDKAKLETIYHRHIYQPCPAHV